MSSILGIKSNNYNNNKSNRYRIVCRICGNKITVDCPAYKYCNICRRNKRNANPS